MEGGRGRRPSWDGQGPLVLRSPKGLASRTNGFFREFFSYGLLRGSEGTELIFVCVQPMMEGSLHLHFCRSIAQQLEPKKLLASACMATTLG